MSLRFTHVDARGDNLPHSPPYNIPLHGCTIICSAIEGHRSCCHFCTVRDGPANDVQDQRPLPPQGMSQEHTALPHVVHIFGFSLQSQILLKQLVPVYTPTSHFLAETLSPIFENVIPASRGCWSFGTLAKLPPTYATWKVMVANTPPGQARVLSCTQFPTESVLR